jgi:hypothetical protein
MTKFGHYQLEVKVNRIHMTQLLPIPTSPPSQMTTAMWILNYPMS